jgi:lipopolysaccharide export system permease protein
MKIITRYVLREFLKTLFFSVAAFGGLVMISEFFRELDLYLEKKAAFSVVFKYFFYNMPWWIIQVLPISVLLAVLFSLGNMSRHNEITAMKAAGVNALRVLSVLFICGVFIAGSEIYLREKVIPGFVKRAEAVRQNEIKKEPQPIQVEFRNIMVSLPENGRLTVNYLNVQSNIMTNLVIDYHDEDLNLKRQLVAQSGSWLGNGWLLNNVVERDFSGNNWTENRFTEKQYVLPLSPGDFILPSVRPEQMTSREYLDFLAQMDKMGISSARERIQFDSRWASAFSHLIVMLIGIPFALGLGSRFGNILSFTFAVLFAFVYWGFEAIGQSFGQHGYISPMLAAWMGNIIFGIVGVGFLSKVKR